MDIISLQNIWRFDYAGIVVLIVTSFVPVVYYSFLCNPVYQYFYLISTIALGKFPADAVMDTSERTCYEHHHASCRLYVPILHFNTICRCSDSFTIALQERICFKRIVIGSASLPLACCFCLLRNVFTTFNMRRILCRNKLVVRLSALRNCSRE